MKRILYICIVILITLQSYCKHSHYHSEADRHMHQKDFDELVRMFESPDRLTWQQPEKVIAKMEPLKGRRVVDLGAGTGLFSFRMVEKGATVTAVDIDQRFLDYIENRKEKYGIGNDRLKTHLAKNSSTALPGQSADAILIVNVYHHIENRVDYFQELRTVLGQGGFLLIVDFKDQDTPIGPPGHFRISADEVVEELKSAGFTGFEIDESTLPYQYIIKADT